jgi:uncharacterized membrane protein
MAGPQIHSLLQVVGFELIYSFVIIVCSLMIYYSTKEMYELSSHKGIKYFRQSFLLFAIAYFFKSFIKVLLVYFGTSRILDINPKYVGSITLFIFMFFGSLAVFYLVYSLICKKWDRKSNIVLGVFYVLSVLISFIIINTREAEVFIGTSLFLLLIAIFGILITHKQHRNKKKKGKIHLVYTLLFIFWILNIIELLVNFTYVYQILISLASLGIFLTILYKVLKKSGDN